MQRVTKIEGKNVNSKIIIIFSKSLLFHSSVSHSHSLSFYLLKILEIKFIIDQQKFCHESLTSRSIKFTLETQLRHNLLD